MSIQNYSDPDLRKSIRNSRSAIIPVGSLEQHGPHLPVSTDSDIVTNIAERVAKKCSLLLLPTITYGVSFEHAPLFNLSISSATLQKTLVEICLSLGGNGIRRIIILNGHHGNQKALRGIEGKIDRLSRGRVRAAALSYWHFMETEFDHAGFAETSLMLAISGKVHMRLAKKGLDPAGLSAKQRAETSKIAQTQFVKATKTGVWGDPRGATRKDGERMIREIVRNMAKTVSKLA